MYLSLDLGNRTFNHIIEGAVNFHSDKYIQLVLFYKSFCLHLHSKILDIFFKPIHSNRKDNEVL